MTQQLPLGLELHHPTSLDDFIAGDNGQILHLLRQQLTNEGEPLIYISGAPGSGRSHLLLGQCNAAQQMGWMPVYLAGEELGRFSAELLEGLERSQLIAIDDIDRLGGKMHWEKALFKLFNDAREQGCRLLVSAAQPPALAGFRLADLRSRLAWGITYRLRALNDSQRRTLLIQLCERRGLDMPEEVARYLVARFSRDIGSLARLVERLDRDSLAERRRLTIPFVRDRLTVS